MTTATVQSIESQIAELNAKKAELEAMSYEERKAEERKQREIKRIEDLTAYQKRVGYMVEQLIDADTGGLLNVKTTTDEETGVTVAEVTFTMNGRENTVDIEEHIVYGTGYRNNRSHGLKYRLSGSYNEYAKRMYKTAKSVLKKIAEHMEIGKAAELRDNAEQKQLNDGERMLKSLYPDAKVERRVEWNRTYNT